MPQKKVLVMPQPKPAPKGTSRNDHRLTQEYVNKIPFAEVGPGKPYSVAHLDPDTRGFMVVATKNVKSYFAQRDVKGKTVRVFIGRTDDPTLTARDARIKAEDLLNQMRRGINPNQAKKDEQAAAVQEQAQGMTLREALDLHLGRKAKGRSPNTENEYRRIFAMYMQPWLDRPIKWLGGQPGEVERLHEVLTNEGWDTETKKGRGYKKRKPAPSTANGVVRALRAVYNNTRKKQRDLNLPEFPSIEMNEEPPRTRIVPPEDLYKQYEAIMSLTKYDPVRRDATLFIMFTGVRQHEALQLRKQDVDLEYKTAFIADPKGGESKAFVLPLTDHLVSLLRQRMSCPVTAEQHPDDPYVFPGMQGSVDITSKRHELLGGRPTGGYSAHDYRRSFGSYGGKIGLSKIQIGMILNHAMDRQDTTMRYVQAIPAGLRENRERICDFIWAQIKKPGKPVTPWPGV